MEQLSHATDRIHECYSTLHRELKCNLANSSSGEFQRDYMPLFLKLKHFVLSCINGECEMGTIRTTFRRIAALCEMEHVEFFLAFALHAILTAGYETLLEQRNERPREPYVAAYEMIMSPVRYISPEECIEVRAVGFVLEKYKDQAEVRAKYAERVNSVARRMYVRFRSARRKYKMTTACMLPLYAGMYELNRRLLRLLVFYGSVLEERRVQQRDPPRVPWPLEVMERRAKQYFAREKEL